MDITSIGTILTWKNLGSLTCGGQIVGSAGEGYKCLLFIGIPKETEVKARKYINELDKKTRISQVHLISNIEEYNGFPIQIYPKE